MAGHITRNPNPKNPSPNPKNPSPKYPNTISGCKSRYPKLLWVIRVSNHGTRITRKARTTNKLRCFQSAQTTIYLAQPTTIYLPVTLAPAPTQRTHTSPSPRQCCAPARDGGRRISSLRRATLRPPQHLSSPRLASSRLQWLAVLPLSPPPEIPSMAACRPKIWR